MEKSKTSWGTELDNKFLPPRSKEFPELKGTGIAWQTLLDRIEFLEERIKYLESYIRDLVEMRLRNEEEKFERKNKLLKEIKEKYSVNIEYPRGIHIPAYYLPDVIDLCYKEFRRGK